MLNIAERSSNGISEEHFRRFGDALAAGLFFCRPGIIQSFNETEQTVTVQPVIRERITGPDGKIEFVALPLLLDVPIILPRAGGYVMTIPIVAGDECLVIFSDSCIDAWWQNGGIQNSIELRRHDLSDGFAILGPWSQPRRVTDYNTTALQIRTEDGSQCIEIGTDYIDLKGTVKVNGVPI